ncbi:MAG: ABC transporter ATP-binding protein [Clostridia bacterium]|nr:ABC transporter ATP-binding protein [Clostridia bacterium]
MRKILSYLKPYRGKIALTTLLMAVSAVCDLLLPTLMADVLDKGVYGAAEANTLGFILKTAGWMLGLSAVSLAAVTGGYWMVYHVVAGYTQSLRSALFQKIHTMTMEEVGKIGTSNLVTRITHDVGSLNDVISMLCGSILIIPLMLLGGVGLCMRKDVTLSLVILCAVPLLLGAGMLLGKRIEHLWEVADEYCDKQNDLVRERLRGIRVIRAFGREKKAHEQITHATHVMAENFIRSNVTMEIIDPAAVFVLNIVALLIIYLGSVRMERGSGLSAGDIFAIIQYINIILAAIMSASYDIVMLPHVRVAIRRLSQITESDGTEDERPAEGLRFSGDIELQHAGFTYPGSRLPALSNVDLYIQKGEWVSVIGGTGSGKTTLADLLMAFRTPTEGKLLFDGRDVSEISLKDIRANVSCAMQKSMLYAGTVEENLRMGKPDATDEELWEVLELAQIADFIREKPEGLAFKLESSGANISGGQKQRLSIARALLKDAPVYIFDDSFSALDFMTEAKVRAALKEKLKGRTCIVITQRVVSAMHSDKIIVLSDGAVVGNGTHEELLETSAVYREIYLSQTGGEIL